MSTPKIRFKGFTDDWEQRKFHEVFDGLPNNTLSRADLNYEKGEAQNIHYGDILVKFGDYVDATTEELPYISDKKLVDKFSNSFLQDGDIIIADTAEDETVGKCTEIVGGQGKKLISGLHTIPCRPRQRYAPKFLGYYMNSNSYHAQLRPLMQGVKVISISKGVLQDTKMVLPQSVGEQGKIGAYFSNLDNLITLHQRKCDELQKVKKYMLQKMFPKKGEKVPEIRFAGFTDDWEQRKLNNVTDVRDGTHDSPNYVEFGHPFITSKNVKDGYINYDDVQYISDNDFEQINRRSKVDVDDILMGMIGTIGNLALIREEPDFAIKNVALIKHTGGANPVFLYSYLQADNVSKQLGNVLAGGTQNFISLRNIRELDVSIPNMQEQNKIGEYFASVDSLITLHQRKHETLKEIKKYMLQNMFPKK